MASPSEGAKVPPSKPLPISNFQRHQAEKLKLQASESSPSPPVASGERFNRTIILPNRATSYRSATREDQDRVNRMRITADSESKMEELVYYGIDVHDFQVDADLRQCEVHSKEEMAEIVARQRHLAEIFRASVIRKEAAQREASRSYFD